jgi:hypothetical protein
MKVHFNGSDGCYSIVSYDLIKKTITTRYKTHSFKEVRLIKEVYLNSDKVLEEAILKDRAPVVKEIPAIFKVLSIPKKSGGMREVYSLLEPYNSKQKELVKELKLKMLSVRDCAVLHKGAKTIISMDIEKAFKSIILGKNVHTDDDVLIYSFHPEGFLMQGTPCSSWIFERIISPIFDRMISEMSFSNLVITRYVDDITISCKKRLPLEIMEEIVMYITTFLADNEFKINSSKTRYSYENGKGFKVLGIAMSQDRMGVRNMKKQAILYWKKGETMKAEGMLSYLKAFLDKKTYSNLKSKFSDNYIAQPSAVDNSEDYDLPF